MSPAPLPTLRSLLARRELSLSLASAEEELAPEALDAPLRWVHSSDLEDPTPFLAEDLLLLTTGTQFVSGEAEPYRAYVTRLIARGVRGLGFGTEVVRDGIPPLLAEACRDAGMPLFEVPYRTPFIALARANAEAIAAQAYARQTWALDAQRALSLAALRPDGLEATVAELAKILSRWVGLFDASGVLVRHFPHDGLSANALAAVTEQAGTLLRKGARAASHVDAEGTSVAVQTLGRGGALRGAIAIADADLDAEGRSLVTSVIALASLSLEQNVGVSRARSALRAGLIHALLEDQAPLVRRVAREVWGPLPAAPVTVAVAQIAPTRLGAAADWLELRSAEHRAGLFFGRGSEGVVVVTPSGDTETAELLATLFDARVGVSESSEYSALAGAHAQAVTARRRALPGAAVWFAEVSGSGVLAGLTGPDSRAVAQAQLLPLTRHDQAHGGRLLETVRTWLEQDARIDETARALGIHRHTVRARIAQAQSVLGVDLSSFPARAELWAALVALG